MRSPDEDALAERTARFDALYAAHADRVMAFGPARDTVPTSTSPYQLTSQRP